MNTCDRTSSTFPACRSPCSHTLPPETHEVEASFLFLNTEDSMLGLAAWWFVSICS